MHLLWPWFLGLLALIPLAIYAYWWMLRRRQRFAVRFSSLSLVRAALPQQSRWRRHVPFALLLAALTSLIVAMSRPVAVVAMPTNQTAIILAIDVSRSMCSTDIEPNRLQAAKNAAIEFVDSQPPGTQIGVVAFAGFAEMVHPPTADKRVLRDVIQSLLTGRRTAVGSAILEAIDAIAEVDPNVAPAQRRSSDPPVTPVVPGAYAPDIIVLLTDGASNAGVLPLDAAQQAVDRGIRVYTIGFGTATGGRMDCGAFDGYEPFVGGFGFGGGGGRFRRGIDEETLIQIADMTGGEYYSAESAGELHDVFRSLPTYLITRHETTEVSAAFAGLGALLTVLAVGLSLRWNPLL
ncbi:VWA domain-containing protein [Litorilinea aerophila]|uniref:VWA domain-containing protein n=1 Tax=Litorilinea aerophila TaxID=1204385 RepID=A0A540V9F9_9CHLR|nr:VWA domain-containing protein [Litorilinea aerophila]MCC9078702.1 VWA domain-containing protein [Litorilinea aerophila]